ncbi:glycosyltransferase [Saccharothrix stipae]
MLFTAPRAHLFPIVPLARACRSAGHDVRLAGAPGAADDMVRTGLPTVVVGRAAVRPERSAFLATICRQDPWPAGWPVDRHLLDDRRRAHLAELGDALVRAADAVADDLVAFGRSWRPDVVVHDAVGYAGAVAAAVLGVPAVRHLFGPTSVARPEWCGDRPLPSYVRMFERFGVDATTGSALTVDPTPPALRPAPADDPWLPVRYVPHDGSGEAPSWPDEPLPRPRICITWGRTMARALGGAAAGPYRQVIEAIGTLDVDIVLVACAEQLAMLGELPDAVRVARSASLHLVLPRCDVIVQQGGDRTTLSAAWSGAPQLVVSRRPDAEFAASRLAATGAGIHLRYQELRANHNGCDLVRAAVDELLADGSYREAAERLREEVAEQPPPAAIVPALTSL